MPAFNLVLSSWSASRDEGPSSIFKPPDIFAQLLMDFRHYLSVQELEPKLLDLRSTSAGITASAKTLSITVHQSKEGN